MMAALKACASTTLTWKKMPGKSLHEDFHGMSGIDLNRAGTPLIEVVTEPDMSNAAEAVAFAKKLHSIVTSLGICDGNMSQGSMRFDVNVSVRRKGEDLWAPAPKPKTSTPLNLWRSASSARYSARSM